MRISPLFARFLALATLLLATPSWTLAQVDPNPNSVEIDHLSGIQNPVATFELRKGDKIEVSIVNTDLDCFEFSQTAKAQSAEGGEANWRKKTRVIYEIVHDGKTAKYVIEATRRANPTKDCTGTPLSERTWEIDVETLGWKIGFAGAYTIDQLTDPVFRLTEQAGQTGDAKFRISRNRQAEDSYKLGAAAMMHLFHSDPDFLGRNDIAWAPLSFGLGLGEDSKTRYFVGTSVRFNTQLFLTVGRVFGSMSRLPSSLELGGTTGDAKALEGLQSRTDDAWFLSLSFTFADMDFLRGRFAAPFQTKKPEATGAQ